jgi:hypothetical protein
MSAMTIPTGPSAGSARNRRVAILTAAALSQNPRALKEAETLARAGFEITVYGASQSAVGRWADEELAMRRGFSFKSALALREDGFQSGLRSFWVRIRTRAAVALVRYFRIENAWQLGPAVADLAKQARSARADYYVAHLEPGSWVGVQLRREGFSVGIDMEDWYSEDLPIEARKSRPVKLLRDLERELLAKGAHATCPSHAMSEALAKEFGCAQPTVIYNAFPWSDRESIDGLVKDRRDRRRPSIHWFSQTLGLGRGLEDLIAALPLLKHEAEIHLRGKPAAGFENWLAQNVPEAWRGRIMVHGLVSNAELLSRIAEHDIGFAGEIPIIRSRDLTVTNKILYYLLAGIAVVASETAGQREVAAQSLGSVFLYTSGDASNLATRLNVLLGSADELKHAKSSALEAAQRTFCWERQEKALLDSVNRAIGPDAY